METRVLLTLLDHGQWADRTMLEAAARLDAGRFTRTVPGSHPSLRETLVHVLWAEELWLARWSGAPLPPAPVPADFPDAAALRTRWDEAHRGQRAFVERLGETDLAREVSYVNPRGETWTYPLWQMIHHALLHSQFHRGQVLTLFRQLGAPPVTTDLLVYVDATAAAAAPARARALVDHTAEHPDAPAFRAGETLAIERRPSEWAGWVWGVADDGRAAWVPEAWTAPAGQRRALTRDYAAAELSVEAGAELTVETRESGWALARDERGRRGWVPLERLQPIAG